MKHGYQIFLIKSFQVCKKSELAGAVALLALVVLVPAITTHMNNAREAEEVLRWEMINSEVASNCNDDKRKKRSYSSQHFSLQGPDSWKQGDDEEGVHRLACAGCCCQGDKNLTNVIKDSI